ncbi:GH92 family glycosyl hydrolase [Rhodohalobacter sp. 614A]|uniref:GH92 family glycosyl hydrolase n=1 Tax=Rhodohalobacter sp. 614A TaxID=2908649 RepID=UPI001F3CE66F|nr:GH92 family glycosyl hydrolase [Rhodohalobacter sp. 614A]
MDKSLIVLFIIIITFGFISCRESSESSNNEYFSPLSYVDPFIGTAAHGHTYPGATVPFGMVQVSPDNGKDGWDYSSGYHYEDSVLAGFSMTHLSGTGIGDLSDLSFMPLNGTERDSAAVYNTYSHENESASPGYYSVKMDDGIRVELTASKRVGFYRYTFPNDEGQAVSLDLGFAINWDTPTETFLEIVNDSLITGYRFSSGWARNQWVYFAAEFSKPFSEVIIENEGEKLTNPTEAKGRETHGFFYFDESDSNELLQKVAISAVSMENALENLKTEVPHWEFDDVHNQAVGMWEKQLQKIQVQSDDEAKLRTFYTALYHATLAPTLFMDVNGQYRGPDKNVHTADGYEHYTIFSLWDTYRAEHPLLTFIEPDRVNDMIRTMLNYYDQNGFLPIWDLHGYETGTMIGYHAVPVIADAYFKGIRDYDVEKAFEAMKKSSLEQNEEIKRYNELGYVPSDEFAESVSKTLEYAYDDWVIAQMAKALGKNEDFEIYSNRAQNYLNVWDESTGFMRPKLANGEWETPFDPLAAPEDLDKRNYTEANAWQYLWYVPQDVPGLMDLIGGKENFVARLDTLFSMESETRSEISDMSGLIGQYVQGNEPAQQIPYFYNYADAPWKAQEMVRTIVDSLYTDQPDGLPGNEDCGQMSAWYIFSSLGFYPANPANGVYVIGSPVFDKASINLADGKTFTVIANGVSSQNRYIQSATLNDEPYEKSYITYRDIMDGATLEFEMGPEPNKEWATGEDARPPVTVYE